MKKVKKVIAGMFLLGGIVLADSVMQEQQLNVQSVKAASNTVYITEKPSYTATPTPRVTIRPTTTATVRPYTTARPYTTGTIYPATTALTRPTTTPTMRPTITPTMRPTTTPMIRPTITPTIYPTNKPASTKKKQSIIAKNLKKNYGCGEFDLQVITTVNGKISYSTKSKNVLTVSKNGRVKVVGCGKAKIKIKVAATAEYSAASKEITVTVKPQKVKVSQFTSNKTGQLEIKFSSASHISGYEFYISSNSDFSGAKKKSLTRNAFTLGPVKSGTKYYMKVRSYVSNNGKISYSSWSSAKSVVVK